MADFIPTEIVRKLAAAGKSDSEIAAQMRLQGFTPSQIDKAIKEAIKTEVTQVAVPQPLGLAPEPPPEPRKGSPAISAGARSSPPSRHPAPINAVQQIPSAPIEGPMGEPTEKIKAPPALKPLEISSGPVPRPEELKLPPTDISLEELVEAIVNERWIKFEERLSIFEKRDLALQEQIQELKKLIEGLKQQKQEEEGKLMEKLEEFGENVEKTQTRIGSIESAFKEFVPSLAGNVRELSAVIEKIKKSK